MFNVFSVFSFRMWFPYDLDQLDQCHWSYAAELQRDPSAWVVQRTGLPKHVPSCELLCKTLQIKKRLGALESKFLNAELKNIVLICWFLDIRYSWHSCDMHRLHRPGKPISFFVKSKASTSCPSEHGFTPAEKGFKLQDIKIVTPRFLDEETPSGDKQRCISHYVKLHESTAWQCYWNCASWELQALQPGKKHFHPNTQTLQTRKHVGGSTSWRIFARCCAPRSRMRASRRRQRRICVQGTSSESLELVKQFSDVQKYHVISCYMFVSRRITSYLII